jgi:hypothetical protein
MHFTGRYPDYGNVPLCISGCVMGYADQIASGAAGMEHMTQALHPREFEQCRSLQTPEELGSSGVQRLAGRVALDPRSRPMGEASS